MFIYVTLKKNSSIYDSIYDWFNSHTKHYMTKAPLVTLNSLRQKVIEHSSSYNHKRKLSSYIKQVIEDKSYILLRCHGNEWLEYDWLDLYID